LKIDLAKKEIDDPRHEKTFSNHPFDISACYTGKRAEFFSDVDVNDPPTTKFGEDWAEMFMNGQKIGYARTFMKREGDEILTLERTYTRLGRGESEIISLSTTETREKLDGTPVSMTSITQEGPLTKKQTFSFSASGVSITTSDGNRTWENEYELEPGYLLSWGFVRKVVLEDPQAGIVWEDRTYLPELVLDRTLPMTTRFFDKEPLPMETGIVQADRIEQTMQLGFIPITFTAWISEDGRLIKGRVPIGGLEIVLLGSTEEKAKAEYESPDIFTDSLLSLNRRIPVGANSVTFTLTADAGLSTGIPESAYQSVEEQPNGSYLIHVRKGSLAFEKNGREMHSNEYLRASPMVDYNDPVIMDLLDGVELDGLFPADQIRQLVQLADDSISIKSLGMGFGSASEAVVQSEGDCTEHALLLTALCRAAGYPARGASGLVYFLDENRKPVMGYHMWTQVWNGADWFDIDAAFGTADPEPIRILLTTSNLSDESMGEELILSLAEYMNQIELTVTAVDTAQ